MKIIAHILIVVLLLWTQDANARTASTSEVKAAFIATNAGQWAAAKSAASMSGDAILETIVHWRYVLDKHSGASASDIQSFIDQHDDWPKIDRLKLRLKQAERRVNPPSITTDYVSELIWEGQIGEARKWIGQISSAQRKLLKTRIALLTNNRKAPGMLGRLTASQKRDAGITFGRIKWRAKRKDHQGVVDLLLAAPKNVPHAAKWWPYRKLQARRAIERGNTELASRLLRYHGLTDGGAFAEAAWMRGWVEMEYRHNPQAAYTEFAAMFDAVTYAMSKGRAAYWTGRAAEKMDERDIATDWYRTAARYGGTFYGQLAHIKAYGASDDLDMDVASHSGSEYQVLEGSEMGRAIRLCLKAELNDFATIFIRHAVDEAGSDSAKAAVAIFAQDQEGMFMATRAGKRAMQHNVLVKRGYPTPKLGGGYPIELPLVFAISRQESEFNAEAKSGANARGIMQLLPGTARGVARKNGISYASNRLYDPAYNMRLGSLYLAQMIERFDGSYVKAIAAYNAGPGRVDRWVREFGEPGSRPEQVVNWIERIEYSETRNYVQRVLENLQLYRSLMGRDNGDLAIEADLLR